MISLYQSHDIYSDCGHYTGDLWCIVAVKFSDWYNWLVQNIQLLLLLLHQKQIYSMGWWNVENVPTLTIFFSGQDRTPPPWLPNQYVFWEFMFSQCFQWKKWPLSHFYWSVFHEFPSGSWSVMPISTYVVLYLRRFGHRDPYQILSVHFTKDPLERSEERDHCS